MQRLEFVPQRSMPWRTLGFGFDRLFQFRLRRPASLRLRRRRRRRWFRLLDDERRHVRERLRASCAPSLREQENEQGQKSRNDEQMRTSLNLRSLSSSSAHGSWKRRKWSETQLMPAPTSFPCWITASDTLPWSAAVAVAMTRLSTENGVPLSPMMVISRWRDLPGRRRVLPSFCRLSSSRNAAMTSCGSFGFITILATERPFTRMSVVVTMITTVSRGFRSAMD